MRKNKKVPGKVIKFIYEEVYLSPIKINSFLHAEMAFYGWGKNVKIDALKGLNDIRKVEE